MLTYRRSPRPLSLFLLLLAFTLGGCGDNTGVDNTPPRLSPVEVDVAEDGFVLIDVLAAAVDDQNDVLTLLEYGQGAHGAVVREESGVRYTPEADYHGLDEFPVTIQDPSGATATGSVHVTITPVNDAPVATADSYEVNEDSSAELPVLSNDTDVDEDALVLVGVTEPRHGTATVDGDGILYTPASDFNGADTLSYVIDDGQGARDTAEVHLTIVAVNDPPTAADDVAEGPEDQLLTIRVLENDTDPDGDALVLDGFRQGEHGTVAQDVDRLAYVPADDFHGTDRFIYYVLDLGGGRDSAAVEVTILPAPDAPVAQADSAATDEDVAVLIDVLQNDTDADDDPLSVTALVDVTSGSAAVEAEGVRFTPAAGVSGVGGFRYEVSDGTGRVDSAAGVVEISAVNDSPVAVSDAASVDEDAFVLIDVLANDTDDDGDSLWIAGAADAAHGSVSTLNGQIRYAPETHYNGPDAFTYRVTDGASEAAGTVELTVQPVNDRPEPQPDSATVDEDGTILVDVLANDVDIDGDSLFSSAAPYYPDGIISPAQGTAAWEDEQVRYTPDPGYNGADSLGYWISDGGEGSPVGGWVYITVTAVNDAPVATDDFIATLEDAPISFDPRLNDTDIEGDFLGITALDATGVPGTATFTATSVSFVPEAHFNGTVTFDYVISDGVALDTATIEIQFAPVNDPPVAVDDIVSTPEDTPLTFDPRTNDFDPDVGQELYIGTFTTVSENFDQATLSFSDTHDSITFTPDPDVFGVFVFEYLLTDYESGDYGTVTIHVTPVNDAPVAAPDSATTAEDTPLTIYPLRNDDDLELVEDSIELRLTGTIVDAPSNGRVSVVDGGVGGEDHLTYTPNADFYGTDSLSYQVTDGDAGYDTANVVITVSPVADPPQPVADTGTVPEDGSILIDVLANDVDPDGDALIIVPPFMGYSPSNGTAAMEGNQIRYTPNANFYGTDSFSYEVTDGSNVRGATVTVVVTPVNDPPEGASDWSTVPYNGSSLIDVLANDSDPDGETVTLTGFTQGSVGTVIQEGDQLRYTPATNVVGADAFTYTIGDGSGLLETVSVNVEVVLQANYTEPSGTTGAIPIEVPVGGNYAFVSDFYTQAVDTEITVYDASMAPVAYDDNYGGLYGVIPSLWLTPGRYYVEVTSIVPGTLYTRLSVIWSL